MGSQRDGLAPLAWAWASLGLQDEEPVGAVPVVAAVPVPEIVPVLEAVAVVVRLAVVAVVAAVALVPLGHEEAGQQVPAVAAVVELLVGQRRVLSS